MKLGANHTLLTFTARYSNKDFVQFLIDDMRIQNINETGEYGRNGFLYAAHGEKIETMKYLNSKSPDLKKYRERERDRYGEETALTSACWASDIETVQFLIEEMKININEAGGHGRNCFHKAASAKNIETMRFLNSRNPDLKNYRDKHQDTALTLACWESDIKTVQFMVEDMQININETGMYGRNCFHLAQACRSG